MAPSSNPTAGRPKEDVQFGGHPTVEGKHPLTIAVKLLECMLELVKYSPSNWPVGSTPSS
jgi:hypothetical protein